MDLDRDSDRSSSPLSSLASRSPSPPPDYSFHHYLSPMSSQQSSNRGSPTPRITNPTTTDAEGPPPPKRRRVAGPKIRETLRLDLSVTPTPDGQDKPIEALMKLLHGKKKVVVIAGAGISVSAGIPDFRSKEGLFQTLRSDYKLKSSGKDLFDASVYSQDSSTSSFHHMVREMSAKTREAQPTPFHHLLARLAHEGRLLRLYTQNVDGIETSMEPLQTRVPLQKPWPKTVQLHGSLEKMVCSKCKTLSEFDGSLFDGPEAPLCKQCETDDFTRTNYAGKRSHGIGRLRPRMVLYNEHNPDEEAIGEVSSADLRTRPDALIVVGTTLKVYGIRKLAKELAGVVRGRRDGLTVWINHGREPSGYGLENCWDIIVKGPCDEVARLAAMPKWNEDPTSDETRAPSDKSSPFMGVFLGKSKGASSIPTPIASPKTEVAIDSNLASLDEKSVSSLQLNGDNDGADGKTMKPESTSIVDMLKSQKPSTKVNVVKKGAPKKNTQPKRAKRAASGKSKKEKATVGNNKTLTNTFSVSKKSKQPANVKPVKKESAEVEHAVIPAPGNDSKEVATSVLQNDDNAPRPRSHIDQNDNNAAKLRSHIPVTHTPSKFTSSLQLPDPFAIESSQSRLESQENIGQAAAIIKPEQHSPHPDSPSQSLHTSLSSIPLKRSGPKISKSDDGSGTDGSSNRDRIELIDGSRVPAEGSFMSISYSDARMHHIPTGVDADVYPLEAPPNPDDIPLAQLFPPKRLPRRANKLGHSKFILLRGNLPRIAACRHRLLVLGGHHVKTANPLHLKKLRLYRMPLWQLRKETIKAFKSRPLTLDGREFVPTDEPNEFRGVIKRSLRAWIRYVTAKHGTSLEKAAARAGRQRITNRLSPLHVTFQASSAIPMKSEIYTARHGNGKEVKRPQLPLLTKTRGRLTTRPPYSPITPMQHEELDNRKREESPGVQRSTRMKKKSASPESDSSPSSPIRKATSAGTSSTRMRRISNEEVMRIPGVLNEADPKTVKWTVGAIGL